MNVNPHNLPSELSFGDYTWGDSNYEGGQLFMKCTSPDNQDLGIVKTIRKPNVKLIIAPFPEHMRSGDQFFFEPSAQTRLTTAIAS